MLGRRNIRDSIGYVTLGLFTNALLDELLEVKRRPDTAPTRNKMITIATDSLEAVNSPDKIKPSRWKDLIFQNYQEARTLRRALGTHGEVKDIDQLKDALDGIIKPETTKDERIENTDKVIGFFGELARMAVINAECPEERVPPGVRQLVS